MVLKFKKLSSTKRRMRKPRKFFKRKSRYITNVRNSVSRPQKLIVKLPYFTSGQLQSAVGAYSYQIFNLNSIYDPDRSGIGHQPLGRDQWVPFYSRYRVFKVDYVITLTNVDPAQAADCVVLNANGIPLLTDDSVYEQPGSFYASLAPRDGGASRKVIKGSVYLPRLNGLTGTQYKSDENTQSTQGASPIEVLTQSIAVSPVITGAEVNVCYSVKYIYHVEMFDPVNLLIS